MERRRSLRKRSRDRRVGARARFGAVFVNKYIDGTPHLTALVDLSPDGMMVQKLLEPRNANAARTFYAIELGIPWRQDEEQIWIWTQLVRDQGDRQALRFVGLSDAERARIGEIVDEARRVV
jgi:hypothetical protein